MIAAVVGLLIVGGSPIVADIGDSAAIDSAKNFMSTLSTEIENVAEGGKGSYKRIGMKFDRGYFKFDSGNDRVSYNLRTSSDVLDPHTSRWIGNFVMSANANVTVNKTTLDGTSCYHLKNKYLSVYIKNVGNSSNHESINTSDLILKIHNNQEDKELNANFTIFTEGNIDTKSGQGYTEAERTGDWLGVGEVKAYVDSELLDYTFKFKLYTGANFLVIESV